VATGARETDEKLDAAYATALKDAWKIVPSEPYTSLPVLGDLVAKQAKDVETLLPQDMYAWCAKMPTDARTHVQKGLASKPPKKYMPASCCTKCTVNGLRHCLGLQLPAADEVDAYAEATAESQGRKRRREDEGSDASGTHALTPESAYLAAHAGVLSLTDLLELGMDSDHEEGAS